MARLRGAAALFFPVFFGAALLLFPDVSAAAAREGVALCLQTVLPSLFPFFVLSSLLVQSDVPRLLSRAMAGVMYPLFGVSGAGASALILGLLGGYPVGARTVAELYGRGEIAREEAEQLLAFCNNSGPGFFLGVCGTAVFGSARAGMYLYLIHVGAALVTGVLLRRDLGLPRRKAVSRQRAPFDLAAALPAAVCDRKGGAGARRRPARAARGAAAFLKGLAPRRRRGYTEGAAFAAPLTLWKKGGQPPCRTFSPSPILPIPRWTFTRA